MRNRTTWVVVLLLTASVGGVNVFAQPSDPAQNVRDAEAAKSPQARVATLENEARLQQLVRSMKREMALLQSTDDDAERQRLMDQHSRHIHETMMLLRVTAGESMSRMLDDHAQMSAPQEEGVITSNVERQTMSPEQRMRHLESRIDMIQMVMESMLDHMTMPGPPR